MRLVRISDKLVNIDNLIFVSRDIDKETGEFYCLFVFPNNFSIKEKYSSKRDMLKHFEEYGLIKRDMIDNLLEKINEYHSNTVAYLRRKLIKIVK